MTRPVLRLFCAPPSAGFPPRPLTDHSLTLADAGLKGAAITHEGVEALLAEEVLFSALERTGAVSVASSESDNVLRALAPLPPPTDDEHHSSNASPLLSVALDPLEPSSPTCGCLPTTSL